MKKKFVYYVLTFFIAIFVFISSCKKDYPKDTPNWLKHKIREYKKNEGYRSPSYIEEYKKDENIVYAFVYIAYNGGWTRFDFYDYSGNEICSQTSDSMGNYCTINGDTIFKSYTLTRNIWQCEFCH